MNPIIKNILAVILGLVLGSAVNMGLIMISSSVIPLPDGVDPADMESLKNNIHLFEARHFIFPFLAHALGTLVGAFIAAKIAAAHQMEFALGIGVLFLIGGVMNVFMLPAPVWFITLDLAIAYLPMGYIGGRWALGRMPN
jgi:hypothetical protein